MKARILILCSDDSHHKYLMAYLSRSHDVCCVVMERSTGVRKRLWQNKKRKAYLLNLYHWIRRKIFGSNRYRKRTFKIKKPLKLPNDIVCVDSINATDTINLIKKHSPDVIIVMGTSILQKEVLDSAGKTPIINIHGGYLPNYRGNHCFFFAVINEDYQHIGSTVHFIDSGVDTGDIIFHIMPEIFKTDTPEKMYCRAEMTAIHELNKLIHEYAGKLDKIPRQKQPVNGKTYYSKDRKLHCEFKLAKIIWSNRHSSERKFGKSN